MRNPQQKGTKVRTRRYRTSAKTLAMAEPKQTGPLDSLEQLDVTKKIDNLTM